MKRYVVLIENDRKDDVLERHGAADTEAILCFSQKKSRINSKKFEEIKKICHKRVVHVCINSTGNIRVTETLYRMMMTCEETVLL